MDGRTLRLLKIQEKYGGSFAAALAKAWQLADSENAAKLEREFRPLLETYARFVEPRAER